MLTQAEIDLFHRVVRHGGFFCLACNHYCDLKNDDDALKACKNCGSHRITFQPAIVPHDYPIGGGPYTESQK